jgi:hypothetical protein
MASKGLLVFALLIAAAFLVSTAEETRELASGLVLNLGYSCCMLLY